MKLNVDPHRRAITYLRVSVTDLCNLRCFYCMPAEGLKRLPHADILTYEEILRAVRVAARIGVCKIRLTGGEPLLRRNIAYLVRHVVNTPGITDVGLTTNGALLKDMAAPLYQAGLRRINISLDTMSPLRFRKITRRDLHKDVMAGLQAAVDAGFSPIKINTVVMRGVNDDEIEAFARMSMEKPVAVRFIEYMPIGGRNDWSTEKFMSTADIQARLAGLGRLRPLNRTRFDGPSEMFKFDGAAGEIGFISAVTRHFCAACNRMRLTAEGRLRPCLLSDAEVDLKGALRRGCADEALISLMREAISQKPERHLLGTPDQYRCDRNMSSIGG